MSQPMPASLRRHVRERAQYRCEYCKFPQFAAARPHEPDHIVAHQHGGETNAENLALACFDCNRNKGPNLGSLDPLTGELVRFYNPRLQEWNQHFEWHGAEILPLTAEGRVTLKILTFNEPQRVAERAELIELKMFFDT